MISAEILRLVAARGPAASICPSEVARAIRPPAEGSADWRPLMSPIRAVAVALAREGRVEILRKGRPADLDDLRGVIRLRQPGLPARGASE